VQLARSYVSGDVILSGLLDVLLCQSNFNPDIIPLVLQLLRGSQENNDKVSLSLSVSPTSLPGQGTIHAWWEASNQGTPTCVTQFRRGGERR
jgi:hypothetical protein